MSKKGIKAPELRFKGFHGDWEQRKLGEVSNKVREKNRELFYTEVLTNSAEFGIVSQESYFDKEIANAKNISGYYIVRPNDFVYNPRISKYAPVGPIKSNRLSRSGIMSPLYYVFRPNNINVSYLQNYFDSTYWHQFMKMNGDSGARADRFAIRDSVFTEMPIPYPTIAEQERIGLLLSKLDITIELHQRKVNILLAIKKAYLKEVFPLQDENTPSLRFNYFNEEWGQREIKNIGSITAGGDVDKSRLKISGKFPVLANSLQKDGIIGYYDEYRTLSPAVTITGRGNIGHAKARHNNFTAVVRLLVLKPHEGYNVDFLEHAINNLKIFIESTGVPQLTGPQFGNYRLAYPTFEEQTTIGNLIKNLDILIVLHQSKLESLTNLKQVYLNKMFI